MVDKNVVHEYLHLVDFDVLDPKKYDLVEITITDKKKFSDIENSKIDSPNDAERYEDLLGLSMSELNALIEELREKEANTNSNNGAKYYTIKRLDAEKYLEQLKSKG
ncbi:MAG: hypothetical protein P4L51_00830 [Puia sp.]|nr:hypothetical protein [Puia sp.]